MRGGFETLEQLVGGVSWFRNNFRIEHQEHRGEGRHDFDKAGGGMSLQVRYDAALAAQGFFADLFGKAKQQRVWAVRNPVHGSAGRLSTPFHKYDHVCCVDFPVLARGDEENTK